MASSVVTLLCVSNLYRSEIPYNEGKEVGNAINHY